MARAVSTSSRPVGSSASTTLTLENPPSRQETLVLRLSRPPSKKVTWKEGTVDNEFLQRKSSKKCCIFHKQKSFDEDDSDDEDHKHESGPSNKDAHDAHVNGGGCCSKDREASGSVCHSGED